MTLNQGANNITVVARDNSSNQNSTTQSITINYQPVQTYTIAVSASPSAGGAVGGGGTFTAGSSRTVTATANSGYTFNNWTEGASVVSTSASYTFTLNGNRTLIANFTSGQVSYDSVLKAPKCGLAGAVCDSGTLLDGRDGITGGPEPNQPNTIYNSCADNTSGTYHVDESIDRIKVSTVDGGNFAPGKTVRIEVTVWAFAANDDYLDLFYAADATNPNWIYFTSLYPATPGAQTLSTTYVLPAGGDLQAVRANFLYKGDLAPCAGGGGTFDDHDDLVFRAQAATTRTLTVVSSNPSSGVSVTVSPNDNNNQGSGTTQFTRTYNNNTSVTLTAPSTAGGNNFQKWQRDGADWSSSQSTSVTMDADHTMTAVYAGVNTSGLQYYPLARPVRLLDTRPGTSACYTPGAPLAGNASRTQVATGTCDGLVIPSTAQAIVGNATVVSPAGGGYLTLHPTGAARPTVSNLNYVTGQTVPNNFTVGLGSGGSFDIFTPIQTHLVIDIAGYYAPPGAGGLYYHPLPYAVRLLDTRVGQTACDAPGAPIQGGVPRTETARIACSGLVLPSNAVALVGNATVVNTLAGAGGGYVTLYPSGVTRPNVSNLNYVAGQVVPNAFTLSLGADGAFNIYAATPLDFIVDVMGYYSASAAGDANGAAGLLYYPLASPVRLLDTRPGEPACQNPGAPLSAGGVRTQAARIACTGVSAQALAVVGNATVVNTVAGAAGGHVTLYPSGAARPNVSNLNYVEGQVVPNAFTVALGADGAFNIYATTTPHFVADLAGYFAP